LLTGTAGSSTRTATPSIPAANTERCNSHLPTMPDEGGGEAL
jgi:hypothetical protein